MRTPAQAAASRKNLETARLKRHEGIVRRTADPEKRAYAREGPSDARFRPRLNPTEERARKARIRTASEPARGLRPPANYDERMRLQWASPRKMAEQKAKTGDYMMPKRDALRVARKVVGGFRGNLNGTSGTRKTFTGKTVRVRGYAVGSGIRQNIRGRANDARHGKD